MNNQLEACDNSKEIKYELAQLEGQLIDLNEEVNNLYDSFYTAMSEEVPCSPEKEQETIKGKPLSPLGFRIQELNEHLRLIRNRLNDMHRRCML